MESELISIGREISKADSTLEHVNAELKKLNEVIAKEQKAVEAEKAKMMIPYYGVYLLFHKPDCGPKYYNLFTIYSYFFQNRKWMPMMYFQVQVGKG